MEARIAGSKEMAVTGGLGIHGNAGGGIRGGVGRGTWGMEGTVD